MTQDNHQQDLLMQALAAAEQIAVTVRVFRLVQLYNEITLPEERKVIVQAIENCTRTPRVIPSRPTTIR